MTRIYVLDIDQTLLHSIPKSQFIPEIDNNREILDLLKEKQITSIESHMLRLRPGLANGLKLLKETGLVMIYSHGSALYGGPVCELMDPKHEIFEWDNGMVFTSPEVAHLPEREPKSLQKLLIQYAKSHPNFNFSDLDIVILDDRVEVWRLQDQKYVFQVNPFIEWYLYCYDIQPLYPINHCRVAQLRWFNLFLENLLPEKECECKTEPSSGFSQVQDYKRMHALVYKYLFESKCKDWTDLDEKILLHIYRAVYEIPIHFICPHGFQCSKRVNFVRFCKTLSTMKLAKFTLSETEEKQQLDRPEPYRQPQQWYEQWLNTPEPKSQQWADKSQPAMGCDCPDAPKLVPLSSIEVHTPLQLPPLHDNKFAVSRRSAFKPLLRMELGNSRSLLNDFLQ